MTLKSSKKKLIASLILFIIGLIALAAFVGVSVVNSQIKDFSGWWGMPVGICVYFISMTVSLVLHISYRNGCIHPGAASTTLFVFQWIFYALFAIAAVALLVVGLFCGVSIPVFGNKQDKVVKVKDEKGNQYKLTPTYATNFDGGEEYEDQNGDLWESWDGGRTFERTKRITPVYINDSEGNELKLTPTFRGSTRYLDEHGDEWWTLDGGQTVERVPKK